MTRALSQDLRSRVIAVVDSGMPCHAAADRFGIAVSSAVRWVRAWRTEGRATALPQGGDLRSHHIEAYREVILAAIEAEVDITLVEIAERLRGEHGAAFAPSTVWRFLDRHGLTFKTSSGRRPACGVGNWPRYRGLEGSGRTVFGGLDPVKKCGPWAVADLRVVTPSGDPD